MYLVKILAVPHLNLFFLNLILESISYYSYGRSEIGTYLLWVDEISS